ncbi:LysR family transcriptional regulator [Pseudomonas sp. AS2.8]|uniref:LysR family transcriptional regulator n=1 Tax=Pseudomonas sp. AS2.8 TaxID=2587128 RepID=UPI00160F6396|nr:LysR family transcriptional regulator [Pseudomonas sp. AS2.8]MBB2895799.1 DNA-binding transcriptional LysR family regulator [Pseudomonas sp. AS2.8]
MNASPHARALFGRLRYKHLLMLVTLAGTRNLHRAAEALHMSQPATTRMLQDVEEAFGCVLFERQARGLTPTALGVEIIEFARRALNGLDRCAEDLDARRAGGYGHLAVGAIMGALPDLVVRAIAESKACQPGLQLRILGDTSDQLTELLEQERIDVAIARFTQPADLGRFTFEPLGNEHLAVVVRTGHPLTGRAVPDLAELVEDWPWILQPEASPARVALEAAFVRHSLPPPADIIECGSVFAMLQLVQITDAILVLTEAVVRDHLRTGLLVRLDLEITEPLTPFGILLRTGQVPSAALEGFLGLLRRQAAGTTV